MKNILVLLLMILLPLQASWSAAAVFCQHETSVQGHWGHHQHEADAACGIDAKNVDQQTYQIDQPPSSDDPTTKHPFNLASHSDHLNLNQHLIKQHSHAAPFLEQSSYSMIFAALSVVLYQSPILDQPEPPLWSA